jgi:hypothetical protein
VAIFAQSRQARNQELNFQDRFHLVAGHSAQAKAEGIKDESLGYSNRSLSKQLLEKSE